MDVVSALEGKRIVIVGAGQLGQMALDLWPSSLKKPELVLDARREGALSGIPIERTADHKAAPENVYVLSFFKESAKSVVSLFRDKFRQEIITVYDVLTYFDPDKFSNGWIGDKDRLPLALENMSCFADEYSKAVYKAVAEWRYGRQLLDVYPVASEAVKYDLNKYLPGGCLFGFVLDGGSYDFSFGTTLSKTGFSWRRLVAFEPDPVRLNVIKHVSAQFDTSHDKKSQIFVDQRALWSTDAGGEFYSNGLLSARIARHPDQTCLHVKTITLPSVFQEYRVRPEDKCLVKLHIEGAEWPVVQASRSLLESDTDVSLLINLSHDEDSLVKIPRMLADIGKYNLHLESHSLFGEGLTLFANCQRK